MNYLAAAVGFKAVPGHALERKNGQYGNVLLTSGEILAVRKLDLSVPGCEPRCAIDADLRIAGQDIRVFVTHLGLRRAERKIQVQRLLQSLSKASARPIILLGDINEWLPGSEPLRWLDSRLGKTPRPQTFPAHFPILALDRIWVTPPLSMERAANVNTPLARIASDHLPLRATIRGALN
jgi:endonuclease/exonuclease/phosphatase family metal-dependent hydrolase